MDPRKVEILGSDAGVEGGNLHYVRDAAHNRYFLPLAVDEQSRKYIEEQVKQVAKRDQMEQSNISEEAFEAAWPELLASLYRTPSQRESHDNLSSVIIDTGLLHDHPFIKGCIVAEKDFTGEGSEDLNGHGTIVALIYRMTALYYKPRFVNVKVTGKDGHGSPEHLVAGLHYLIQYKREHPQEEIYANISLGVYTRKWGGAFQLQWRL